MKRARKSLCKNDFSHTSPFHNPFISLFFSLFFYLSFLFILFFVFLFFIFLVEEAIGGLICLTNTRSLQPFYLSLLSPIFNLFFQFFVCFYFYFSWLQRWGRSKLVRFEPRSSPTQVLSTTLLSLYPLIIYFAFYFIFLCESTFDFFWGLGFGEVRRPLQLSPTPPPLLFSIFFLFSIIYFPFYFCCVFLLLIFSTREVEEDIIY